MSETPSNVINLDEYRASKEGTVFNDDNQVDLHRNNTVPDYNAEIVNAGREAFNAASSSSEKESQVLSPVEVAAAHLRTLQAVRLDHMRIEDKPFLRDVAA